MELYRAAHPEAHASGQPARNTVNRSPPPGTSSPSHTPSPTPSPTPLPTSPSVTLPPAVPLELIIDGARKAIMGYTWPGIEEGEPPAPKYSFFEYAEAVRSGTIEDVQEIQEKTKEWWSPTLDRGSGALLHFAVDHGRLDMVRYLVDEVKVPVNHQSMNGQWTPLHRCARMVHYKHAPFFDIFEFLLERGADPNLETEDGLLAFDMVVHKGYQWEEGEVRRRVRELVERHRAVTKAAAWFYTGKSIGEVADGVMSAWRSLPSLYPPEKRDSKGKKQGTASLSHGRLS